MVINVKFFIWLTLELCVLLLPRLTNKFLFEAYYEISLTDKQI